jgi:uncharacterized protein (TIGR03086 family)
MIDERGTTALLGGVELLERAIGYTQGSLMLVTSDSLANPTPCVDWDLHGLLAHMMDSLVALSEAAELGHIDLEPSEPTGDFATDAVATLHRRACHLLGAWSQVDAPREVSVGDASIMGSVLTGTGALEIAVHGWDVARACGHDRPIPPALAEYLLELAPLLVRDADRPDRFAAPVGISPLARPSHQLVAYLGRSPLPLDGPLG